MKREFLTVVCAVMKKLGPGVMTAMVQIDATLKTIENRFIISPLIINQSILDPFHVLVQQKLKAYNLWWIFCLSIWGFGWKPTAFNGILKTQSRQNLSTPIYGIPGFLYINIVVQLYEPRASCWNAFTGISKIDIEFLKWVFFIEKICV